MQRQELHARHQRSEDTVGAASSQQEPETGPAGTVFLNFGVGPQHGQPSGGSVSPSVPLPQ